MAALWFEPEVLVDSLSETVGYKAGLALSVEAMCDHLAGTQYADLLLASEHQMIRVRAENYDELFYKLLYAIGYTEDEYDGDYLGIRLFHKYRGTANEKVYMRTGELFLQCMPPLIEQAKKTDTKVDPIPYLKACADELGPAGLDIAIERLDAIDLGLKLSPTSPLRYTEWRNTQQLDALFDGGGHEPELGQFIDQRFINYLAANPHKMDIVHWRKFEEFTAEYFHRSGYQVQLGPGRNDDGVDVRIWKPNQDKDSECPDCIVQCKRHKDKIAKLVIKGLYADLKFEGATRGLVVTTSELSPGARKTIQVRGYPVDEVNRIQLKRWLTELQVPGTGVMRV